MSISDLFEFKLIVLVIPIVLVSSNILANFSIASLFWEVDTFDAWYSVMP